MDFAHIIQAGVEELGKSLDGLEVHSSFECFYGHFLLAYHRADFAAIKDLAESAPDHFQDHPEWRELKLALELRIRLRERKADEGQISLALNLAQEKNRWEGELLMLAATAHTLAGRYGEAQDLYRLSVPALERIGARRKALRARFNVLSSGSHLDKKANIIPQYYDLHRRALEPDLQDYTTAGHCLLNISREYELMGTLQAALKYATEAIHLSESLFGTQQYFLCLAHRAHLLCELKRFTEARVDFECALAGEFPEVLAALKLLKPKLDAEFPDMRAEILPPDAKPEHLLPTWKERGDSGAGVSFSPLESLFVEFLGSGPKDKFSILDHLYGGKLDYEVKLSRFKSMLTDLRRKSPHMIVNEKGSYRLADEVHRPVAPSRHRRKKH